MNHLFGGVFFASLSYYFNEFIIFYVSFFSSLDCLFILGSVL